MKQKKYPNEDSSINPAGVSECCQAPIKAACGDDDKNISGTTCWMECQKCFKPCNFKLPCTCDIGDAIDDIGHFENCPALKK